MIAMPKKVQRRKRPHMPARSGRARIAEVVSEGWEAEPGMVGCKTRAEAAKLQV